MIHKVLFLLVSIAVTSIISVHEIEGSEDIGANLKKPEFYENFEGGILGSKRCQKVLSKKYFQKL